MFQQKTLKKLANQTNRTQMQNINSDLTQQPKLNFKPVFL